MEKKVDPNTISRFYYVLAEVKKQGLEAKLLGEIEHFWANVCFFDIPDAQETLKDCLKRNRKMLGDFYPEAQKLFFI